MSKARRCRPMEATRLRLQGRCPPGLWAGITWLFGPEVCELAQTPQKYYARRRTCWRQEVDLGLVLALVSAEREQQPRLGAGFRLITSAARSGCECGFARSPGICYKLRH